MNGANNPLNVKQGATPWKGSTGANGVGTAIFPDPVLGVRAAMRTLHSKWLRGKINLAEIIADWAPADDTQGSLPGHPPNDPARYAAYVAGRVGYSSTEALPNPSTDPLTWAHIIRVMAHYEMGEDCHWPVILRGVAMWYEDFVKPE